jgi:GNAT superfamily N-acetyltransferase
MQESDIGFAVKLTDIERWNYLEDDFRRLISWEPEGCFIARHNNRRVGMITTTSYDDYAFIGCLIVIAEERGHGFGELLLRHALDYFQTGGIRTIELDGVFRAVPMYRRLGFRDKYLSLRFIRKGQGPVGDLQSCPSDMINNIIAFDSESTGLNRERIIRRYSADMPDRIHAVINSSISAYAIVRPRSEGLTAIGPLVADSTRTAKDLLHALISRYGSGTIAMGVPEINREAVKLALQYGFQYFPPSLRMYWGRKRDYEKNIFAIFSAEKG